MEAAAARRRRLLELRAKAEANRGGDGKDGGGKGSGKAQVHFRNYVPDGERGNAPDDAQPAKNAARAPAAAPPRPTAMPDVPPPPSGDAPPEDVPSKPNADLRRDVAKQLATLERRTQQALVEIAVEEERRRGAEAAAGVVGR